MSDKPKNLNDLKEKLGLKKKEHLHVEVKDVKSKGDVTGLDLDFHQETAEMVLESSPDFVQVPRQETMKATFEAAFGKGSLKHAEEKLQEEVKWYPSSDGEAYLWDLLWEKPFMTSWAIETQVVSDNILDWGYVCRTLKDMVEDGVVVDNEGHYSISTKYRTGHTEDKVPNSPNHLEDAIAFINEIPKAVAKLQEPAVYYCEQCFHTRGEIVELRDKVLDDPTTHLACPNCLGEWRLNRGYARHLVSLKLQHYRKLAKELGILEIEEEAPPV